jgi:putative tryptophan/tyrosine transport system substrate-binding protein
LQHPRDGSELDSVFAAQAREPNSGLIAMPDTGCAIHGRRVPGALSKLSWIEGSNVSIEIRWAGPDVERIDRLAKELAGLRPDVMLGQTTPVVRALAREAPTTPIVFVTVSDPIGSGFVASLAHPGGNITGFTVDDSALGGK